MYKTEKSLKGHSPFGLDRREGGLLIHDENKNVMDLQLFSFDEDPNSKYYFGYLELKGAYEVIRDFMDKEDEEILTDTRDGFHRGHPFYRELKKAVDRWLKKIISKDQLEESKDSLLSKETKEKQKEAFKQLNELYEKINADSELLLGEDEGKKEGLDFPLEFSTRNAKIILGKKYKIRLSADTDIVKVNSKIKIDFDHSRVKLNPSTIMIKKPESGKIYSEYIEITPLIIGKEIEILATYSEDVKATLTLEIVEEEYHQPENIVEFYPRRIIAPPSKTKSANLYINMEKTDASYVTISTDSKSIHIGKNEYNLKKGVKILRGIAKISIPIKGLKEGTICEIEADCGNEKALATIEVRNLKDDKKSLEIFNDWTYKPLDSKFQAFPNIATKKIDINSNHPINQHILGKNREEAEMNFEAFPHCQLLIADLILTQFLHKAFFDARENGMLRDPNIDIIRYIEEEKFNIGNAILKLFVKDKQIHFFKSISGVSDEINYHKED